ncbi:MAG: hypothetical protein E7C80_05560, partial [Rothia mucilaginosa]|nr:hypothetical protein [Rothia mucilaginosa]
GATAPKVTAATQAATARDLLKILIRISFQKNDVTVIHIHNPQSLASRSQEIHRMLQTEFESAILIFPVT